MSPRTETETPKKAAARLQHVVAHIDNPGHEPAKQVFDEVLVFGQEIDALRSIIGKTGWVYAAVAHGQSFVEALKAVA